MSDLDLRQSGLKTAVEELHDPAAAVPDTMHAEQMALLPLESAHIRAEKTGKDDTSARGVGRPKGSKNKNTEAWRDFLLARYPSPLVAMAEVMSRPIEDLAKELLVHSGAKDGVKPTYNEIVDLLKIQLSCAKELMPYLHQKQPMAIEAGDAGLMTLNIFSAPVDEVQKADDFSIEIIPEESVENQGVSAQENEKLNAQELNACQETPENCGVEGVSPTDNVSDRVEGKDHE